MTHRITYWPDFTSLQLSDFDGTMPLKLSEHWNNRTTGRETLKSALLQRPVCVTAIARQQRNVAVTRNALTLGRFDDMYLFV